MNNFEEIIEKDGQEISFEMIHVEGGSFMKGSEDGDKDEKPEKPVHEVNIPKEGFSIGKYPVTQDLYENIMGENPSHFKRNRNPVEEVSWEDTQAFIKRLNEQTGKEYRLPSESEWEYAARGGVHWQDGFGYSGSNNLEKVGWHRGNSHKETKGVGLLKANQLGIHDMTGNVWEWCEDYWQEAYDKVPKDGTAMDIESADRVMRGGSWYIYPEYCRVAYRHYGDPSGRSEKVGFRLILSP